MGEDVAGGDAVTGDKRGGDTMVGLRCMSKSQQLEQFM